MKRKAFIHTTQLLKNSINLPSLVLESVPIGAFSRVRQLEASKQETILEGIILDLSTSSGIDEIIIVTSDQGVDDEVERIVLGMKTEKPLQCVRIDSEKSYGVHHSNRVCLAAHWPYMHTFVYGAWHVEGFQELMEEYSCGLSFIGFADSMVLLDVEEIDKEMKQFSEKGIIGKVPNLIHTQYAILNTKFFKSIIERYEKKGTATFERTKDRSIFSIERFMQLQIDFSGRTDFRILHKENKAPLCSLYKREELGQAIELNSGDLSKVKNLLKSEEYQRAFNQPSYLEVELMNDSGLMMSFELFEKIISQDNRAVLALNLRVLSGVDEDFSVHLGLARSKAGLIMLDIDNCELSLNFYKSIVDFVDLIQINAPEGEGEQEFIKNISDLSDYLNDKPIYLVVQITPQQVRSFDVLRGKLGKLVIKSESTASDSMNIDFAPLERIACRKLEHSLSVDVSGKSGPCQYLPTVNGSFSSLEEAFVSSEMLALRKQHLEKKFDTNATCQSCRDWYIRDIIPIYPLSFCFNSTLYETLHFEDIDDGQVQSDLQDILKNLYDIIEKNRHSMLLNWSEQAMLYTQSMVTAFSQLFFRLGDLFMKKGKIKEALNVWEAVLKIEPNHSDIHQRLDEILLTDA